MECTAVGFTIDTAPFPRGVSNRLVPRSRNQPINGCNLCLQFPAYTVPKCYLNMLSGVRYDRAASNKRL